MATDVAGRTGWDFLSDVFNQRGIWILIIVILMIIVVYMIMHPIKVREWNTNITMFLAMFLPRKRKKAFEKKLNLTVLATKMKLEKEHSQFFSKFLPYDLKVNWVSEDDELEASIIDKQVIVYVPTYKEEPKIVTGVLYNYCERGFAEKTKYYMDIENKQAINFIATKKMLKHTNSYLLEYFNNEFVKNIIDRDESFRIAYDRLSQIDKDGLFLPLLINELEKYTQDIYPNDPCEDISTTIKEFTEFIYKIASKEPYEAIEKVFFKNNIRIAIILAVSESNHDINYYITDIQEKMANVDTIYILASGKKLKYAETIAKQSYEHNPQNLTEPTKCQYKRYTRNIIGKDSVCYELNVIH